MPYEIEVNLKWIMQIILEIWLQKSSSWLWNDDAEERTIHAIQNGVALHTVEDSE